MDGPTFDSRLLKLEERTKYPLEYLSNRDDDTLLNLKIKMENEIARAYRDGLRDGYAQGAHDQQKLFKSVDRSGDA